MASKDYGDPRAEIENSGGLAVNLNGNDSQDWVQIGNGKPPATPKRDSITANTKRYGRGMRG